MALSIRCGVITDEEGKELEAFLMDMEGVESVEVEHADEDLEPGRLQASASYTHMLVTLAIGAGGSVGVTILNEASKDLYKAAKVYIIERLEAWKQGKIPEARREWVGFELDEQDELVRRLR